MFRPLKNWMSGVVLFSLIAASVAPAFALTISFDTQPAPLTIVSSTPAPAALDVDPTSTIQVILSKHVNWGSAGNILHLASDNSSVLMNFGYNSSTFTISVTPSSPLLGGTQYYVDLSPFYAADGSGGISSSDPADTAYFTSGSPRLYFTTVANIAAQWTNATTGAGAQLPPYNPSPSFVPINATIVVTATKALNTSTITTANIKLYQGANTDFTTQVTITPTLDGTGKIITVQPSGNLAYGSHYHLELTNVADTGGNILP